MHEFGNRDRSVKAMGLITTIRRNHELSQFMLKDGEGINCFDSLGKAVPLFYTGKM